MGVNINQPSTLLPILYYLYLSVCFFLFLSHHVFRCHYLMRVLTFYHFVLCFIVFDCVSSNGDIFLFVLCFLFALIFIFSVVVFTPQIHKRMHTPNSKFHLIIIYTLFFMTK